ncbi:hypothetical protein EV191_11064 [Tamaricihabitans halophyticus]|uniref:Uncharacterized protein n=1 Tax=Tamaricihabitans halophyticus TaxID=1262583 RepID=A0A4R2QH93_9PSEU|nr:hypothetical protein [Tamaricihabitans halophyticus]TCP48507.1 hypothetical protein EV191_11064 [Tamaricihabitans halophyticus]
MAELPIDSYQVAVALHPNIWHGHGAWQVRSWLADCLRSGMVLLPEIDGWRSGLIAADIIIGDHGSVTGYGAALGHPTLLATFADTDIDPASPIAALGSTAQRLDRNRPLLPQLEAALRQHDPRRYSWLDASITSAPGDALNRLRALFYRLLALDPPAGEPPLDTLPAYTPEFSGPTALRVSATVDAAARLIKLVRFPAMSTRLANPDNADATHLLCQLDHPQRTLVANASVVCSMPSRADANGELAGDILHKYPSATLAAITGNGTDVVIQSRSGDRWRLAANDAPPTALASAVYAWIHAAYEPTDLEPECTVELNNRTYRMTVVRETR